MERHISQITNRFFNSDIQHLDSIIDSALKQIGQATKVDRISMLEFNTARTTLKVTHEWVTEKIPTIISLGMDHFEMAKFEDVRHEFKKDSILIIPDCTQIESSKFASLSPLTTNLKIQTLLIVPLVSQKRSFGLLFFQSIKNLKNWDEIETDLALLKMLGEIFSIVQERRSSEQLFHSSFVNSPNMMVILRKVDLVVLNVNSELLRTLEYTREELLEGSDESISVFEDVAKRNQMMVQFDRDGT